MEAGGNLHLGVGSKQDSVMEPCTTQAKAQDLIPTSSANSLDTAALWMPSFMRDQETSLAQQPAIGAQLTKPHLEHQCDYWLGNSLSEREYTSVSFRSIKQDRGGQEGKGRWVWERVYA